MNKKPHLLMAGIAMLFLFLASACGTTLVLRADYNEIDYTVGVNNIPGNPPGDQIENVQDVFEVNNGPTDGESLEINGSVNFRVASHETPDDYLVVIRGARSIQNFVPNRIIFMDAQGHEALRIVTDGNDWRLITGDNPEVPRTNFSYNVTHEIQVRIRTSGNNRIDFSFAEPGEATVLRNQLDILDTDFGQLHHIRFEGESSSTYYLEGIFGYTNN